MNTTLGKYKHFGSLGLAGLLAWWASPWLSDRELVVLLWFGITMTLHFLADLVWPEEEPLPTWAEMKVWMLLIALFVIFVMWSPGMADLKRVRAVLLVDLTVYPWLGWPLMLGFLVAAVLVHRHLVEFERVYMRGWCLVYAGMTAIDGVLPAKAVDAIGVGIAIVILALCGFWGPEAQRALVDLFKRRDRPRGTFGQARFEDDRRGAERGGLKGD